MSQTSSHAHESVEDGHNEGQLVGGDQVEDEERLAQEEEARTPPGPPTSPIIGSRFSDESVMPRPLSSSTEEGVGLPMNSTQGNQTEAYLLRMRAQQESHEAVMQERLQEVVTTHERTSEFLLETI